MELKESWKPFLTQFKTEADDRSSEVDPYDEHDWLSLTVGWAIAKGLSPEDANDFAIYATTLIWGSCYPKQKSC